MPWLLRISEAAILLGCSRRHVENLLARGELPFVRIGSRARRIDGADLRTYILDRKEVAVA